MGNSAGAVIEFDPVKGQVVSQTTTYGTVALFNGATLAGIGGSNEMDSFRACDMAQQNKQLLPGTPIASTVFAGRFWMVYGNGALSVR